jgi:hypothetical protein
VKLREFHGQRISGEITMDSQRPKKFLTIVRIGLFAGTLDITDNLIFNLLRGVTPRMVFQYIASALIGRSSLQLGGESIALGVVLHYTIALSWTFFFYSASRKLAVLSRRPVICGLLYGGTVYLCMNFVVLPLTRLPYAPRAMTMASRINGVLALLLLIGLTISLMVRRFAPPVWNGTTEHPPATGWGSARAYGGFSRGFCCYAMKRYPTPRTVSRCRGFAGSFSM